MSVTPSEVALGRLVALVACPCWKWKIIAWEPQSVFCLGAELGSRGWDYGGTQ